MVELTLNKARVIVRNAIKKGRELNLKPLSVVVLDSGGHVIAFEKENYASPGRFDIARGKAYGSIMLGMSGTAQMARAEAQQYFMSAVNGLFGGNVIPVPGGVLIKNKNENIAVPSNKFVSFLFSSSATISSSVVVFLYLINLSV